MAFLRMLIVGVLFVPKVLDLCLSATYVPPLPEGGHRRALLVEIAFLAVLLLDILRGLIWVEARLGPDPVRTLVRRPATHVGMDVLEAYEPLPGVAWV